MAKLYGVGINDADYKITAHKVVDGKTKTVWTCPYYIAWGNMLRRCYSPVYQEDMPTYKKVKVAEEWLLFSNFRRWMESQYWQGGELDKDILSLGKGELYSPSTCCFVNRRVNSVLHMNGKTRGKWPIGVTLHTSGKFLTLCKDKQARQKSLGYYSTPEQAHAKWQIFKADVIEHVAIEYCDTPYYREDVYQNLLLVVEKLRSDNEKGIETVNMWK